MSPSSQNGFDGDCESSEEEKDPAIAPEPATKSFLKRQATESKDSLEEASLKKPKITIEPVRNTCMSYSSLLSSYFKVQILTFFLSATTSNLLSKAPPSINITPVRSQATLHVIPRVLNSSLSITKLGSDAAKLWFMGSKYKCLVDDCNKTVYDELEMLKHMRSFHEIPANHLVDIASNVEICKKSYTCKLCHLK